MHGSYAMTFRAARYPPPCGLLEHRFMCGDAAPQVALELIERALAPASRTVKTVERGAIILASLSH
jgi:hypothetical protein